MEAGQARMGVEIQCAQQARTLGAPFSSSRKATFEADITEDLAESLERAALPSLDLGAAGRSQDRIGSNARCFSVITTARWGTSSPLR